MLTPVCVILLLAAKSPVPGRAKLPNEASLVTLNRFAITMFLTPRMPTDACHVFWRNNWSLKKLIGAFRLGGSPVRMMKSSTAFFRATGSGNCEENKVSRYPAVLVVAGTKNPELVVVTFWM